MRRLLTVSFLLVCLARPLSATVILPAEFREIVAGSQIIVYGRVVGVRSEWSTDRTRIDSFVTVQTSTFLRGTSSANVTFQTPGGQVGRYKSVTVGAPEFRVGDEAVLFLRADGPAVPRVFGLNQGVFRVRIDARSGRRTVQAPLMARGEAAERVVRGARSRAPIPIETFVSHVRAALQGGSR